MRAICACGRPRNAKHEQCCRCRGYVPGKPRTSCACGRRINSGYGHALCRFCRLGASGRRTQQELIRCSHCGEPCKGRTCRHCHLKRLADGKAAKLRCACGQTKSYNASQCVGCALAQKKQARQRVCIGCGVVFHRTLSHSRNKGLYCTRECAFANYTMWRVQRKDDPARRLSTQMKAEAAKEAARQLRASREVACADCGLMIKSPTGHRKRCGPCAYKRQLDAYVPRPPELRPKYACICDLCERPFMAKHHSARWCSIGCRVTSKSTYRGLVARDMPTDVAGVVRALRRLNQEHWRFYANRETDDTRSAPHDSV